MCGIFAVFSKSKIELPAFDFAFRSAEHRGPDASRTIYYRPETERKLAEAPATDDSITAALAHARLSIRDTRELADQPLKSQNGQITLAFNGEIYNHEKLRLTLTSHNYRFKTDSDTEVLANILEKDWIDSLPQLNGMFSFLAFDHQRNKLLIARDRFGIKPLYIHSSPESLIAASEIKQIWHYLKKDLAVNPRSLTRFLEFGHTDLDAQTMFAEVEQICPGHYAIVNIPDLSITRRRWYRLPVDETKIASAHEASSRLREIFIDSVKIRSVNEVRTGFALSGGIDSSAIVSAFRYLFPETKMFAINIGSQDSRFDESGYARTVAQSKNIDLAISNSKIETFLDQLDTLVYYNDEPFSGMGFFSQWQLFENANHNEVKVLLTGQGADEMFAGYDSYLILYLRDLFFRARLFGYVQTIRSFSHRKRAISSHYRRILQGSSQRSFASKNGLIDSRSRSKPEISCRQALNDDILQFNIPKLLHLQDRSSMAHSVEARIPFLDHRLVEVSCAIDPSLFFANGLTKAVFRDSIADLLPQKIHARKSKLGFSNPEVDWAKANQEFFAHEIQSLADKSDGIVSPKASTYFRENIKANKIPRFFWNCLCASRWMNRFCLELR